MKFYTGNLEYDEIYYDSRTQLETVCREENENGWGKIIPDCYMAVSKVTYSSMTWVCAVRDCTLKEQEVSRYIEEFIDLISSKVSFQNFKTRLRDKVIKECTLTHFMTVMKDNALARLFSDKSIFLEQIGLDEDETCFKEYLLGLEYWDKENKSFERDLLTEEIKRISKGRHLSCPMVQPVHYAIYEDDMDAIREIIRELLHHLCLKGRICNRRLVKINAKDILNLFITNKIQNLNNIDGGCAIAVIERDDKDVIVRKLLQAIYSVDNNYSEKYTTIIVLPNSLKKEKYLRECCPQWAFVELTSKPINRREALEYFNNLLTKDKVENVSNEWKELLGDKANYSKVEVLTIYRDWFRNVYNIDRAFPQYKEQIKKYFSPEKNDNNPREELEQLIGLVEVKHVINEIVDFFKLQKMRSDKNSNIARPTMHMVFYGNPGTAKTTVARLVGQILKEEKILEKGKFFEVGRADLMGRYVGWTAQTVKEYFEKAKGSVLFIDEAYALVDEQKSFGDEAINTIVQEMENHREDVVVIMAGYKKNMEELFNKNQGLRSRISFHIEFPDYSNAELCEILQSMVLKEGFELAEDATSAFVSSLDSYDVGMGNGRFVRNVLDRAKIKQATRVLKLSSVEREKEMFLLRGEDFWY